MSMNLDFVSSVEEMEFYLMLNGWVEVLECDGMFEWHGPDGTIAMSLGYAYARQREKDALPE